MLHIEICYLLVTIPHNDNIYSDSSQISDGIARDLSEYVAIKLSIVCATSRKNSSVLTYIVAPCELLEFYRI